MRDEVVEKAAHMVTIRKISKVEITVYGGDMQKEVYFVISALLRRYYIDINGNDITRFFIKKDSFCGSKALLKQELSKCCIEELDHCKVLVINGSHLKELIEANMYCMKAYIKFLKLGQGVRFDLEPYA
ncbi:Crp/Fnr family transcriptional regulator [Clostridium magnum]|nr:cyclic nucleotide-binding domain-containing protein [Clostridium magnum]